MRAIMNILKMKEGGRGKGREEGGRWEGEGGSSQFPFPSSFSSPPPSKYLCSSQLALLLGDLIFQGHIAQSSLLLGDLIFKGYIAQSSLLLGGLIFQGHIAQSSLLLGDLILKGNIASSFIF